jgi:hypothetical protein
MDNFETLKLMGVINCRMENGPLTKIIDEIMEKKKKELEDLYNADRKQ